MTHTDRGRRNAIGALAALLAVAPASAIAQRAGRLRPRRVTICDHAVGLVGDPVARKQFWSKIFAEHGFIDGENLALTVVHGRPLDPALSTQSDQLAREVVAGRPEVIVVTNVWLARIHRETREIPIVFIRLSEYHGYLKELRRPGTNVTGVRDAFFEMQEKKFAWLKQLHPAARRMAVVGAAGFYDEAINAGMVALGSRLGLHPTRIAAGFDVHPDSLARELRDARIDVADFLFPASVEVAKMLVRLRVAASFSEPGSVINGGLLAYNQIGFHAMAVALAVRVLRGEKVETLPVEQPTEFHLGINLRTARALGITVPDSILVSANEVIE